MQLSNQSPRSVMEINTINTSLPINDSFDRAFDNLILSHFLVTYNVDSINELNPNFIQNRIERSLYDLIIQENSQEQREPTIEHINILPTDNICSDCDICFESSSAIDKVELNCQHQMCKSCITLCLNKKNTCPFCRIVITKIVHKEIHE